jgi:hypothetical protein
VTPPLQQLASWFAGCVLIGWVLAYNALRLTGDDPSQAALPGLVIGGVAGALVFAVGYALLRRLWASGRVVHARGSLPEAEGFDETQRDALRLAGPVLLGTAAIALVTGLVMAVDWLSIDGTRPKGTLLLLAWNVVFAAWAADEALRVRRGLVDGLESVYFGCLLTAVLAATAISREVIPGAQVVLVVAAGLAGAATGMALWRLGGGRGLPLAPAAAVVVAAASLVVPLVL